MKELFNCSCHSRDHTFIWDYDSDPDWHSVILSPYLSMSDNIWTRLKIAFSYVFMNKQSRGCFDEILLERSDVERLNQLTAKALQEWPQR